VALVKMRDVLQAAAERGCAVGAFNVFNLESTAAVLDAATRTGSPCVLALAESHLKYNPMDLIGPALLKMAADAPVPVAVQFDHGKSLDAVKKALELGFSAVMWDGYDLPFDEKVAQTRTVVELASATGAAVEAPLGRIAKVGETAKLRYAHDGVTDPGLVEEFCRRTGIENLAVVIGTVHGSGPNSTRLDLDLLKSLPRVPGVYFSLHGGSGVPDEDYRKAIALGLAKISIFTRVANAATRGMAEVLKKEQPRFPDLLVHAKAAITEEVSGLMRIFDSKAALEPAVLGRATQKRGGAGREIGGRG